MNSATYSELPLNSSSIDVGNSFTDAIISSLRNLLSSNINAHLSEKLNYAINNGSIKVGSWASVNETYLYALLMVMLV